MKNTILSLGAILLLVALALGAAAASGGAATPATGSTHMMGVRVQYLDLSGNHHHTDCEVHLVNTSRSLPITIKQFVVLGPGGITDVIGRAPHLNGATIAPLGELRVPIDTTIPGVTPQTALGAHGVRNAVVHWSGLSFGLKLEARQSRYPHFEPGERFHWISEGYEIFP